MTEYNIGDKFVVEIINKNDEPLAPYINSQAKDVTVYQLKGIPFMLDADTLSNFEKFEERKKGNRITLRLTDVEYAALLTLVEATNSTMQDEAEKAVRWYLSSVNML